jgi:hypothetical protein
MPNQDLTRKTKDNLLFIIKTSAGSDMFRHIFVKHSDGREFDATDDGDKSCAYHTSGVLALVGLIDNPHATVETTLKHMQEAGWYEAKKPIAGAVVLWPGGKNQLSHSGFYLDELTFVSNSSHQKQPVIHGKSLKDGRLPSKYYIHPELLKQ